MHRTYHLSRIPTLNRKIRVVVDWTLRCSCAREVVALGELHEPREPFTEVTPPIPLPTTAGAAGERQRPQGARQTQTSVDPFAGAEQLRPWSA